MCSTAVEHGYGKCGSATGAELLGLGRAWCTWS